MFRLTFLAALAVSLCGQAAWSQTSKFGRKDAEAMAKGTNGAATVHWRDRLTDADGKELGVFDGVATSTTALNGATGKQEERPSHTVLQGVDKDGSTYLPGRDLAARIVAANRTMTVKFRGEFQIKPSTGDAGAGGASGKGTTVLVGGFAEWGDVANPATGKPAPAVQYVIEEGVDAKDGSTYLFAYDTAAQLVKETPGLTVRCRGDFTDKAGKAWGLVDGTVTWRQVIDPATGKSAPGVGRDVVVKVAANGSTSTFSKAEAEQMAKGAAGVRATYLDGEGNARTQGWAEGRRLRAQ